jgi:hypothetical protein
MAIRGVGRRPDRPTDIGADLDRMTGAASSQPEPQPVAGEPLAAPVAAAPLAADPLAAPLAVEAAPEPPGEPPKRTRRSRARPPAEAATDPAASPEPEPPKPSREPDPNRIGVVVIHGIGNQKPGETLLLWAHSLLRIVNAWAATTAGITPDNDHAMTADIDLTGATRPWVAIDIPPAPGHDPQTWLLTEAWWAARVTPPSLTEMYRWLIPSREIANLLRGVFHGVDQQDRTLRAIDTIFLRPFVWIATAASVLVYILLSAVRLIPYQPLRDSALLKSLDTFLIDWFGDLRVLLTDRAQAASIRSRAIDAIRACRDEGCGTIVVIGHSGGTIVGYTTLADRALEPELPVTRFITLGQAIGIGWRLGQVDNAIAPDRDPDKLYQGDRLRTPIEEVRAGVEWHDFWSTHDPAPSGGFANAPSISRPSRTKGGTSSMIFNHMSLLEDHGGYWDNDEEFLLPVARLIDTSPLRRDPAHPDEPPRAAIAATSRFFPDGSFATGADIDPTDDDRVGRSPVRSRARQARVAALQRSWALVMAAGALAVPVALIGSIAGGSPTYLRAFAQLWSAIAWLSTTPLQALWKALGIGLPGDPQDGLIASLLGFALMAGSFWLAGKIASSLWEAWDARERKLALQPVPQWRSVRDIEVPLWLCGIGALTLVPFAATGDWRFALPALVLVAAASLIAGLLPKGDVRMGPG